MIDSRLLPSKTAPQSSAPSSFRRLALLAEAVPLGQHFETVTQDTYSKIFAQLVLTQLA